MLDTIGSGADMPAEWIRTQWERTEQIAGQAAQLASQFDAVNKLTRYIQLRGRLWQVAYDTQEEWIGDLAVNEGMSRSSLFALSSDIEMALRAGASYDSIFDMLANTPTALRDARTAWLDENGDFRDDLNLPEGGPRAALETMAGLSPSEARAYVQHDVARRVQRFIRDAVYSDGKLLMTMVVRPDDGADYAVDVIVSPASDEVFEFQDAAWLSRRAGKELRGEVDVEGYAIE